MNKDYSEFVPDVTYELIQIKNLVANQEYQRRLSESQILKAVEEFDLQQINPVKVSRRNGINYVFDGQHTIEVVAAKSQSRETPVWCMIYDGLKYEREAQIFAEQKKHTRALVPYDTFKAHLESGSPKHLMIRDVVRSYGLEISSKKGPGCICAIAAIVSIYDKYNVHVLDRCIRLCIGAWEGEQYSLTANILNGIARMVAAYGDTLKDDVFKEKLGVVPIKVLTRNAKERRPGSLGFAEAMVLFYNRKCKYRLSMKKLYANNASDDDFDDDIDRGFDFGDME